MAVSQVNSSFQNDGNFSELDLQDVRQNGPTLRIETFRCSQPCGEFGVTAAGTPVEKLAGNDHLEPTSNRIFRHIFSVGNACAPKVVLEIRETFDEFGALEVRTRDIDGASRSFGSVLIARASQVQGGVHLFYEVRRPEGAYARFITSPLTEPVAGRTTRLVDIAGPESGLGTPQSFAGIESFEATLRWNADSQSFFTKLDAFGAAIRAACPEWTENVQVYERMGDFRDKCIHDGTNLIGSRATLASEYILIRAYRMSLITLGRIFDIEMSVGADRLDFTAPLALDTKPGVYAVFLSAYALNIGLYQLGIDKVHSDYGAVPMKLRPGSRIENGTTPIVDATNLNRMLARLAALYYAPAALHQVVSIDPAINGLIIAEQKGRRVPSVAA